MKTEDYHALCLYILHCHPEGIAEFPHCPDVELLQQARLFRFSRQHELHVQSKPEAKEIYSSHIQEPP